MSYAGSWSNVFCAQFIENKHACLSRTRQRGKLEGPRVHYSLQKHASIQKKENTLGYVHKSWVGWHKESPNHKMKHALFKFSHKLGCFTNVCVTTHHSNFLRVSIYKMINIREHKLIIIAQNHGIVYPQLICFAQPRSIMQQNADSTCRKVKCKIKTQAINVKNN